MDMHAIKEELLEAVFSVQSVTRLYNKDQTGVNGQQLAASYKSWVNCHLWVRWLAISMVAEEPPLLEAATKQGPVKTKRTEKTKCVLQWFVEYVDQWECYSYL
jgi:hypothetical protein